MSYLTPAAAAVVALAALCSESPVPRTSGALRHEAYVWQRSWDAGVERAVRAQSPEFARIVVLGAEIEWTADGPRVARCDAALDAARAVDAPGVALRIEPWRGRFDDDAEATRCVVATAERLLDAARASGVEPSELQVDFDCATSKLAGYRRWIGALRRVAAPTPVTFTALPAWLASDDFAPLAAAADGYVLQVHSLEPPHSDDDVPTLCDPARARRWVERAARVGVPFRVALPTYGYVAAFRPDGSLLGLDAEREPRAWPAGTRTVPVAADAGAMARLVRAWTHDRPEAMRGAIWYRLPMPGDRRNWTADALRLVRRGETPTADVVASVARPEPALAEIRLRNNGSLDGAVPSAIDVRWSGARLVDSDALAGFTTSSRESGRLVVRRANDAVLAAGSNRMVAWLRFDGAAEVTVDASR